MTTNFEIKNFIWYCPSCGKKHQDKKLSISKFPLIDFYRRCDKCGNFFDVDNKQITISFNE